MSSTLYGSVSCALKVSSGRLVSISQKYGSISVLSDTIPKVIFSSYGDTLKVVPIGITTSNSIETSCSGNTTCVVFSFITFSSMLSIPAHCSGFSYLTCPVRSINFGP